MSTLSEADVEQVALEWLSSQGWQPVLDERGPDGLRRPLLAASTGAACTSGIPEPSHVLRAMGLNTEQAESSVRFSFGRFTTNEEIEEAAHLLIRTFTSLKQG